LKILGDRALVKVDEAQTTEGGIYLPESAQEKRQRGEIAAVAEGSRLADVTGEERPRITLSNHCYTAGVVWAIGYLDVLGTERCIVCC